MNAKEHAERIRQELKDKGYKRAQFSVRAHSFSMGSSVDVVIKDARVPIKVVREVVSPAESIRRCEYSGEILSGGNRYTSVRYSEEALQVFQARWLPAVQEAIKALPEFPTPHLIPVKGSRFLVGRSHTGSGLSLWTDAGHVTSVYEPEHVARQIGERQFS